MKKPLNALEMYHSNSALASGGATSAEGGLECSSCLRKAVRFNLMMHPESVSHHLQKARAKITLPTRAFLSTPLFLLSSDFLLLQWALGLVRWLHLFQALPAAPAQPNWQEELLLGLSIS